VNKWWHWVAYEFAFISIRSFLYSFVDGSVHIFMQILPNLFHATCNANGILSWYNNIWTQWCSPGMLTRGALQQGRNFGITAGGGGGGGGEFVLPDQKGVSEVVPEGRTFDQSLIKISFPKIVGERSIFHYHFFLSLLLFNLRHANIFKICPTKMYGYTRWDRDRGCHPPPHTHTRVVLSLFSKRVLN
jgi:hypothetical protein